MANIKSQKKRILTNEKARLSNKAFHSQIKTAVKRTQATNVENREELVKIAISLVDRGVKKGVMKPNKAARTKSSLMRK